MRTCYNCGKNYCGRRGLEEYDMASGRCATWSPYWFGRIAGMVVLALFIAGAIILIIAALGDAWKASELEHVREVPTYSLMTFPRHETSGAASYLITDRVGLCEVGREQASTWYYHGAAHPVQTVWYKMTRWPDLDRYQIMAINDRLVREATGR